MSTTAIDPRYPIGSYEPRPFSDEQKKAWLNDIKFLPQLLENAIVNLDDFDIMAANFGLPGDFTQGDFDYNGTVGLSDFNLLAARFGVTVAPDGLGRTPSPFGGTRISNDKIDDLLELSA